ncbi:MAG: hypothetical protein B6D65_00780 [candidate division Zixibacteria bacterium 4484_93]|nr:MAG: hypothetical protein B6D65_00780 [candidate division Zixibacteria bacterium 4484_93]
MKMLIVQTAFLGDQILTTPFIRAVKRIFPDSLLAYLTTPVGAEAVANNPNIDEYIIFDKHGRDKGITSLFSIAKQLRKKKFNTAFLPHRSFRSGLLVYLAGIPERIGYKSAAGSIFYTKRVTRDTRKNEALRIMQLLTVFGLEMDNLPLPELFPSDKDISIAQNFIQTYSLSGKRIVGFAPGSVWRTKRYPEKSYVELGRLLIGSSPVDALVIVGGEQDYSLCKRIASGIGKNAFVFAKAGSILATFALMKNFVFLVSNDSAPGHIASAAGIPVVSIFGPTVPEFGFAPIGEKNIVVQAEDLPCRPCAPHGGMHCPKGHFLCMNSITPEKIFYLIEKNLLKNL